MPAKKGTKKAPAKATAKKVAAKKSNPGSKLTAIKKPITTKTAIFEELAQNTGLTKKEVGSVFDALGTLMERHLKPHSAGQVSLPGLMKVEVKKKPATKARKGKNPFTGEETVFKAKPARRVIKIRPLKKLKDMAA